MLYVHLLDVHNLPCIDRDDCGQEVGGPKEINTKDVKRVPERLDKQPRRMYGLRPVHLVGFLHILRLSVLFLHTTKNADERMKKRPPHRDKTRSIQETFDTIFNNIN
jgi:hypothetical protein